MKIAFDTKNPARIACLLACLVGLLVSRSWAQDAAPVLEQGADAIITDSGSITSRILGGADAEPGEWPSVVAIVRPGFSTLDNRLFCGGTVVAARWVMTAAHCVFNSADQIVLPSSMRVVAGINDLLNDIPLEETVVTNIIVHPDYDNGSALPPSDIALLELGSDINAPATALFAQDTEAFTGRMGFIVGWGAIRYVNQNDADYPNLQQDASVPLVSLETCNSDESYKGNVTSKQLCAGFREGGIDACAGDSGGPLFLMQDGEPVQAGITSFGLGCAQPNFYGIYTNVSHFIPWLGNYIDVPSQTPELVAEREITDIPIAATGDVASVHERLFGGAVPPLSGLVLALMLLVRLQGPRIFAYRNSAFI